MNKKLLLIGILSAFCTGWMGCITSSGGITLDKIGSELEESVNPSKPTSGAPSIKPRQNRLATFKECSSRYTYPNFPPVDTKLVITQNGLVKTFHRSKNPEPSIRLSRNSNVEIKVVSTGYQICGVEIKSMGAQLAGGAKKNETTFVNQQFRSKSTTFCTVELRETLYEPRAEGGPRSNRLIISNCGTNTSMTLFITYTD